MQIVGQSNYDEEKKKRIMTSQYTRGSVTSLYDFGRVFGRHLDTFLLGSHNFMVMALGLCVKWP